jgi:hypothetical protein
MNDRPDTELGKTFTALVRIHEANCKIDFPSDIEQNFRVAVMKKIAAELGLRELHTASIAGPSKGIPRPAVLPPRKP